MTDKRNAVTTALVTLTFVAAWAGLVHMTTSAAKAIADAYIAPSYGSAMLDIGDEF